MKKILMLSSSWGSEYTKTIIDGIREQLAADCEDFELHICNSYDDWDDCAYFAKDQEIFTLPDPDDYDGLILCFNSVKKLKRIDEVAAIFTEKGKPIVSIDKQFEGATFCGLDNYRSMYSIVEHMVTIHDCRTLNYVGGPIDHEEDIERFRAYSDCLKAHGITIDPKRILHKGFMREDGEKAYNEFKAYDYHMPDVVICANDMMAVGYTDAAVRDGILVPDYLKVTGFDDSFAAIGHSPSITSVNRNWKQLGKDAVIALFAELNGQKYHLSRYTEGYTSFHESCGCEETRDILAYYNQLVTANTQHQTNGANQMHVRQLLISSRSYKDFQKGLKTGREDLGYADIAVFSSSVFRDSGLIDDYEGYSDEFDMFTENEFKQVRRNEFLYPAEWKAQGENTFLFSSLHYCNCTIGYSVMPYRSNFLSRIKLRTLNEGLSLSLGNIIMRRYITSLKKQLKETQK